MAWPLYIRWEQLGEERTARKAEQMKGSDALKRRNEPSARPCARCVVFHVSAAGHHQSSSSIVIIITSRPCPPSMVRRTGSNSGRPIGNAKGHPSIQPCHPVPSSRCRPMSPPSDPSPCVVYSVVSSVAVCRRGDRSRPEDAREKTQG